MKGNPIKTWCNSFMSENERTVVAQYEGVENLVLLKQECTCSGWKTISNTMLIPYLPPITENMPLITIDSEDESEDMQPHPDSLFGQVFKQVCENKKRLEQLEKEYHQHSAWIGEIKRVVNKLLVHLRLDNCWYLK